MSFCRYCGESFIGDRAGIGVHVSSLLMGALAGAAVLAFGTLLALVG